MSHMPMSSPMMTTMFGGCCAVAGLLIAVAAMNETMRPSPMFLIQLMLCFSVGCPKRADSRRPGAITSCVRREDKTTYRS